MHSHSGLCSGGQGSPVCVPACWRRTWFWGALETEKPEVLFCWEEALLSLSRNRLCCPLALPPHPGPSGLAVPEPVSRAPRERGSGTLRAQRSGACDPEEPGGSLRVCVGNRVGVPGPLSLHATTAGWQRGTAVLEKAGRAGVLGLGPAEQGGSRQPGAEPGGVQWAEGGALWLRAHAQCCGPANREAGKGQAPAGEGGGAQGLGDPAVGGICGRSHLPGANYSAVQEGWRGTETPARRPLTRPRQPAARG